MESAAVSVPTPPTVVFRDGLGDRRHIVDPTGREAMELLCLRPELASVASFEFALRERVSHLSSFRHPSFAKVRGVERMGLREPSLAIVSDSTPGLRLSDMLAEIEERRLPLDINTALYLLHQLIPAIAALHETSTDIAHGAIAPERLIVTPQARLMIVEHVLGAALEQLRFSPERYWTEVRAALPKGQARFDQRADATQIGAVALSLLLGRPLHEDEYPGRVTELVASTWAVSARGGFEPLPAGLRAWLGRALQLDPKSGFTSAIDALAEFEKVVGDTEAVSSSASLEQFLVRYQAETAGAEPRVRPAPRPIEVVAPPAPQYVETAVVHTPVERVVKPIEPVHYQPIEPIEPLEIIELGKTTEDPLERFAAEPAAPPVVRATPPRAVVEPPQPKKSVEVTPKPSVADVHSRTTIDDFLAKSQAPETTSLASTLFENAPPLALPAGKAASRPVIEPKAVPEVSAPITAKKRQGKLSGKLPAIAATIVVLVASGGFAARHYLTPAPAAASGTLVVTTDPPGAALIVDGEARGATPMTLTLSAGAHTVELSAGGNSRSIPVTISAGKESSQYIELTPGHTGNGQLQVKTDPPGAQVMVDGVARGVSPLTVEDLTPGEHAVVLTSATGSVKHSVTVEQGTTGSLVVTLGAPEGTPVSGWVSVSSPIDVQLFEKDRLLGTSATDQIMVSAGRHDIDIVNEALGYRVTRTLQVPAGKTVPIKVELPKGSVSLNAVPWADVWIDGDRVGETPIGNLALAIGPHDIVFRNPELGEVHHNLIVTLKAPTRLSVDLRKK